MHERIARRARGGDLQSVKFGNVWPYLQDSSRRIIQTGGNIRAGRSPGVRIVGTPCAHDVGPDIEGFRTVRRTGPADSSVRRGVGQGDGGDGAGKTEHDVRQRGVAPETVAGDTILEQ